MLKADRALPKSVDIGEGSLLHPRVRHFVRFSSSFSSSALLQRQRFVLDYEAGLVKPELQGPADGAEGEQKERRPIVTTEAGSEDTCRQ